jgi:hypothetical protein
MASADTDAEDEFARMYMDEQPQAAVIADVATDPGADDGPVVQEEGVGRISEIHVITPVIQEDGSILLQVAKGGVFSYYEFSWPANDRLTDEKWREMLDGGQAPALPGWMNSFRADQGENASLQLGVLAFQKNITDIFWGVAWADPDFSGPLGVFQEEIETLRANVQYEGRRLLRSQFTSFDLQSESSAVVTTRETWDDRRYNGEYPGDYFDETVIPVAHRGPYTIAVTYTLQRVEDGGQFDWEVTAFSYNEPPPGWE